MPKANTTVKIKASNETLAQALFGFIQSNFGDIKRNLDTVLRSRGIPQTDVSMENVDPDKMTMEISENPSDKGDVFYRDPKSGEINICSYKDLEHEEFYGIIEGGVIKIMLFMDGEPDRIASSRIGSTSDLVVQLRDFPGMYETQKEEAAAQEKARIAAAAEEEIQEAKVVDMDGNEIKPE